MSLKHMVRRELVTCSPSATVQEVARLMRSNDVGAVLIVEDGMPEGILTDRDLALRCLADETDSRDILAVDVMTPVVETVSEDEGIYDVAEKMKLHRVRRMPVVDKAGKAVGLLSFDDVFQLVGEEINNLKEAIEPRETKLESQVA